MKERIDISKSTNDMCNTTILVGDPKLEAKFINFMSQCVWKTITERAPRIELRYKSEQSKEGQSLLNLVKNFRIILL